MNIELLDTPIDYFSVGLKTGDVIEADEKAAQSLVGVGKARPTDKEATRSGRLVGKV